MHLQKNQHPRLPLRLWLRGKLCGSPYNDKTEDLVWLVGAAVGTQAGRPVAVSACAAELPTGEAASWERGQTRQERPRAVASICITPPATTNLVPTWTWGDGRIGGLMWDQRSRLDMGSSTPRDPQKMSLFWHWSGTSGPFLVGRHQQYHSLLVWICWELHKIFSVCEAGVWASYLMFSALCMQFYYVSENRLWPVA